MDIREAARQWKDQCNVFPTEMIRRLMCYEPGEWQEVTLPQDGQRVRIQPSHR